MSTKLLVDEPPLQVLPTLARLTSLNEAIALQQLHYRMQAAGEGWVRASLRQWRERDFPFWSERTIDRTLGALVGRGLVVAEQRASADRAKRYRIDYLALREFKVRAQVAAVQPDRLAASTTTDRQVGTGQAGGLPNAGEKNDRRGETVIPLESRRPGNSRDLSRFDKAMR